MQNALPGGQEQMIQAERQGLLKRSAAKRDIKQLPQNHLILIVSANLATATGGGIIISYYNIIFNFQLQTA